MRRCWILANVLNACSGPDPATEPPGETAQPASESGTPPGVPVEGLGLFERLAGLWTGPARDTPLGTLPLMNVDFRAADAHTLWGRVDVDPDNALRFALAVEDHGGPGLVYRNGGYFLGLLRDDRTLLVDADEDAGRYRFCHLDQGCDYIDATFAFDGPDDLAFDVRVRGAPHVAWAARRAEPRELPEPFPADAPLAADTPLPSLATQELTVTWSTPLEAPGDVWVLLSTSPCATATCTPSRASRAVAPIGAIEAVVQMPEIHAGDYLATAVLDRDGDLVPTLLPDPQDGVSLPDRPVTVPATGTGTATLRIVIGG
jgi:hypothetical protein